MKKVEITFVDGDMDNRQEHDAGFAEYDGMSGLWEFFAKPGFSVSAIMIEDGEILAVYADRP